MPVIPPQPITNQITPSGNKPYVQQQTFGQMIGSVQSWAPSVDTSMISIWLNNAARQVYDFRLWYGCLTKGQIVTPPYYSQGTITATLGSASIVGVGTNFTSSMVGMSLRVGYNTPIYNIISVTDPTHLTLELPWGFSTLTDTSYYIVQYYYTIPNIKYIHTAINLQLQFQLRTTLTQKTLDARDPSRQQIMYPVAIAGMPPDKDGNFQCELWPASMTQQAIPYLAYVQPPNLVNDSDTLIPFIRCDIVVARATADALRYRTKSNPNYSEGVALAIATEKMKEFEGELMHMAMMDENLYRTDVESFAEGLAYVVDSNGFPMGGATLAAMSPVGRTYYGEDWG